MFSASSQQSFARAMGGSCCLAGVPFLLLIAMPGVVIAQLTSVIQQVPEECRVPSRLGVRPRLQMYISQVDFLEETGREVGLLVGLSR